VIIMSNPNSPQALPLATGLAAELTDDETAAGEPRNAGPTVGASDADADAARSGADADLSQATRDSDGVLVGEDDLEADKRNSGA
jgi:hypothetical protein